MITKNKCHRQHGDGFVSYTLNYLLVCHYKYENIFEINTNNNKKIHKSKTYLK